MKKILLATICVVLTLCFSGCSGTGQTKLEAVQTSEAPNAAKISAKDYSNNLEGLQKYFIALDYIPKTSKSTTMMANVIGAKDGVRYNFTVDSSPVYMELYEYNTDSLNADAKRVINEIKNDGKFYVFQNDKTASYEATLSDNGKYLMIYTDSSTEKENTQRKKDAVNALKGFYK